MRFATRNTFRADKARALFEANHRGRTREAAEYAATRARVHAPYRTGRLFSSIDVRQGFDAESWDVLVPVPYAWFVHHGTVQGDRRIPPNPFLQRAVAEARQRYPDLEWGPVVRARSEGVDIE